MERIIEGIFEREGDRYGDATTSPPIDQPTGRGGITLDTLSAYLGRPATVDDLKALTHDAAVKIVQWQVDTLVRDQHFDQIADETLRLQMIDFSYNSGPARAIRWLQRVLQVPRTGVFDGPTRLALPASSSFLVNQALIAARLQMIDLWTDANAQRKAWEEGLESRGLAFSRLEIP